MGGAINGRPNLLDPGKRSRRGFVVNHAERFDLMRLVGGQAFLDLRRVGAAAPVTGYHLHLDPQPSGELGPKGGKLPGFTHQHPVAGFQHVDQRGLPGAGPRGREDDDRVPRLENRLDSGQDLQAKHREFRSAMINGRTVDGPKDAIWNVGRAGDLQEMATSMNGHGRLSFFN